MTRLQQVIDRAQRHAANSTRVFHLRWARYFRMLGHHYNRAGSSILAARMFDQQARHLALSRPMQ